MSFIGSWSADKKSSTQIQEYADKVKSDAQNAVLPAVIGGEEFKRYDVVLYREQTVEGLNIMVKVDTGNGDDKFLHFQFTVPIPGTNCVLTFTAAKLATKTARLGPPAH